MPTRVYGHGRKCECEECLENVGQLNVNGQRRHHIEAGIAALTPAQLGCRVIMASGKLVYREVAAPALRHTEPETC